MCVCVSLPCQCRLELSCHFASECLCVCEDLRQICVNLNTSEALEQICMLFLPFFTLVVVAAKNKNKNNSNSNNNKMHTQSRSGNGAYEYFRLLCHLKLLHSFLRRSCRCRCHCRSIVLVCQ